MQTCYPQFYCDVVQSFIEPQTQFRPQFTEEKLETLLGSINQGLPSSAIVPWLQDDIVPFVSKVLPQGLVSEIISKLLLLLSPFSKRCYTWMSSLFSKIQPCTLYWWLCNILYNSSYKNCIVILSIADDVETSWPLNSNVRLYVWKYNINLSENYSEQYCFYKYLENISLCELVQILCHI